MRMGFRDIRKVTILDLDGRLVAGVGDQELREVMRRLLADGRDRILVNFGNVTTMDSSGIGELVSAWKHARDQGSTVAILRPGDRVRHTLHLSQILPLLQVYEDEKTAVDALSGA